MLEKPEVSPWFPPRNLTPLARISDYVPWHAQRTPDNEASVLSNHRTTYAQLNDKVDACAMALLAAGIKKGDRVATLSTPHPDYFVTFLASVSIGAIWLGLNPRYQLNEYRHVINDAQPVLVFTRTQIGERSYAEELQALQQESHSIRTIVVLNHDPEFSTSLSYNNFINQGALVNESQLKNARDKIESSDPALLVYTSGSTGKPKGALLPHRGLVKCALVHLEQMNVAPVRCVNFFPINHVASVSDWDCYALVSGGTIAYLEKFSIEGWLDLIQKEKITYWVSAPTGFQLALNHPEFSNYDLSSIQIIVWGGGAMPRDCAKQLADICPQLMNIYGLTETTGNVTFIKGDGSTEALVDTIGHPPPAYANAVRIMNDDGLPAVIGEEGEILVWGDFIMLGYLNNPQATAETIDENGWLHTGDIGVLREDGNIQLVGRCKEMFKSGGYNVYPLEIEQALETHPAVEIAIVVKVDDELYGEVGYAYLKLCQGEKTSNEIIIDYLRQRLANYKIPKYFSVEDALPLLPVGKVNRAALKVLAEEKMQNHIRSIKGQQ